MSPSSRTQTFAHLAQDKAERQLQPASGRGRGKGKGRGRGIKSTETPLVHETMADLNGPENHERHAAAPPAPPYVHETLADLNNPDPNSIQPKAPRGKRAKTPATTAPQSDKPKGEAAPKTSRTKKGADLKPSSEDKPARKYRKKDHVASGTSEVKQEPESDKESTTPQPSESDGAKKQKQKKQKQSVSAGTSMQITKEPKKPAGKRHRQVWTRSAVVEFPFWSPKFLATLTE